MTELLVRLSSDDVVAIVNGLADEIERRGLAPTTLPSKVAPRLSLEELAGRLAERMPARSERQWAKYLYEHAPRGHVPGARKVGSRWWFPAEAIDALCEGQAS